jgi:hypothetical protein
MALGISERMIQRAFGAQDLSPIYNTLSAANQRIAAEDRARKIEAEKRYYTELADINKQKIGIREADIGDVTKDYNQWSAIEKQLSSNPSLITRNPEQYGRLKNEANTLYSKMLSNIQGSKEFAKEERSTYQKMVDPNNLDDWDDGAGDRFKADVLGKPISYIRQNNTDNMSSYYRKTVDGGKFYTGLQSALPAIAKYEPEIDDTTYPPRGGVKKVIKYKGLIPSLDVARNAVEFEVNQVGERLAPVLAKQELDKAIESKDYDNVIAAFSESYPKLQKQFNLPDVPSNIFDEALPAKAKFINYMAAKSLLSNYSNPQKTEDYKTDPIASLDYKIQLQEEAAKRKEARVAAKTVAPQGGVVSIAPLFKSAAAGGQAGVNAMREASNSFNSIGFSEQIFPFTAAQAYQNAEGYNIGTEIVSTDTDRAIRNNSIIRDVNSAEGKEQAKNLAAAMNKVNKSRGFFDTDITPQSLTSGRVMVMTVKDKDNNSVNTYLNVAGPNSPKFIDRKLGPTQMSAKEKRQSVGGSISSGQTLTPSGFSYVIDENGDVQIINE